jgi:sugar lactone lactonase YvrE
MRKKKLNPILGIFFIFCLFFFLVAMQAATIKLKVIVDEASVKASPEIAGQTLARVALSTILDADPKEGSWYKVYMEREGVQMVGYIHEMLVEEFRGEVIPGEQTGVAASEAAQGQLLAEINLKIDENKNLVRQERDLDRAVDTLRPLIAKAFGITDPQRQKEMAAEIYLWMGLAYAGQDDYYAALKEFKNMFEVEPAYSKEMTRNIIDPDVIALIQNAENEYKGLITEYSLEIATEPKEAAVFIDGEEIGLSPEVYRTPIPKFLLRIEKEGFKPVEEEIFLTIPNSKKEYVLESAGKSIFINSSPPGAQVFMDEQQTGLVTNCEIPLVPFGTHKIYLVLNNHAPWEGLVDVQTGPARVQIEVVFIANRYGYRRKWGGPTNPLFVQPTAIAFDNENNFYVTSISDVTVRKFDASGRFLPNWGDAGKEFKKVKEPGGIAVDSRGTVFVTDLRTNSVMIFSKAGVYVSKWDKLPNGDKAFEVPLGIAVDNVGDIYVADSGNHRVLKFASTGAFKKSWGKQGAGNGDFTYPTDIAFNQRNEVYILDSSRIQKFNSEGQFIEVLVSPGSGDGQFNNPRGISVDAMNNVYVSDSGNNRIQKFDPSGKVVATWGTRGAADGQISYPMGIYVDARGNVYVVERDNNRVQLFGIGN